MGLGVTRCCCFKAVVLPLWGAAARGFSGVLEHVVPPGFKREVVSVLAAGGTSAKRGVGALRQTETSFLMGNHGPRLSSRCCKAKLWKC